MQYTIKRSDGLYYAGKHPKGFVMWVSNRSNAVAVGSERAAHVVKNALPNRYTYTVVPF